MRKSMKGFSLVELIITITVLMVIMGGVMGLMMRMSAASADQRRLQAQHSAEQQARMALLNIVRDVRMSDTADVEEFDIPGLPVPPPPCTCGTDPCTCPPPPPPPVTETYRLILTAIDEDGYPIRITYELDRYVADCPVNGGYDTYILTRTIVCDYNYPTTTIYRDDYWENLFVPTVMHSFEPTMFPVTPVTVPPTPSDYSRVNIAFQVLIPTSTPFVFDGWNINSAASFRRMPSAP
ncbi:MAG: prepilin-type N-terminal cleavage/methylation domain-containing protein [Defluviitaleaceae bacterium]|nr:prepilin-type N-terminal cleavage/methylation domain-containing protein [Defluviitaleaceae bacterium]MCL2262156.1 prepilin-type N-terminal cleavage/methylation domain-containing protein [Defluviitaleaceae bacterium]